MQLPPPWGMVAHACNPSIQELRQDTFFEFKAAWVM